jgi:alginate O-acetyltransferase complex protein AlgI
MFPQLIAGPIVRYSNINERLENRTLSLDAAGDGAGRFMVGLGKKVIIANSMGALCSAFFQSTEQSVLFYWLYAIAFTLQIYYDFSGYSDMAIGLGKILGFEFIENFNYPYISRSITEFWRRWHMSLGSWFRDYLYIPMGGNRVSKPRWFFNIFVVWFCTGFWHGANWNFMVWGLYFAVLLVLEKLWLLKALEKSKALGRIYTMLLVIVGFVIFNAANMNEAFRQIGGMFGAGGIALCGAESLYYLRSYALLLALAIIGCTPAVKLCAQALGKLRISALLRPAAALALLVVCTAYLVDGSFNPFLYFRF